MRTIGDMPVTARYIGDRHVIGRYIGERQVFADYIRQGLLHQFDGKNNTGAGVFDPNATVWVDLVTGLHATLQNVVWQNYGVLFSNTASKVFYQGQSVRLYTIFSTHKVLAFQGAYPRLYGENPYPTLYLSSTLNYAYGLFDQGKDTYFRPRTTPPLGEAVQTAMRFGDHGTVELFLNGVLIASIPDVVLFPEPVLTMYIGCRATNDRAFSGEIYEHLVYDRPLSDDEIYHNYLVTRQRYL